MEFAILLHVGFTQISGKLVMDSNKLSLLSSNGDLADAFFFFSSAILLPYIQGWVTIGCN
jgi:hypothetical protein